MYKISLSERLFKFAGEFMFPLPKYEEEIKKGNMKKDYFMNKPYRIRFAKQEDLDALVDIEAACWAKAIQSGREEIEDYITDRGCMVFLLEYQEKVVGAMYVQRTEKNSIKNAKKERLAEIRKEDGTCAQCIALNILPEYQDKGWGFELLEFVLQFVSLNPEIKDVCAVTRCRDFLKSGCKTLPEYMRAIYKDGMFKDPIIKMHQLHGASVLGLIKNYRVKDLENQGYGVLVSYDIKTRKWHGRYGGKVSVKKDEDPERRFIEYLEQKLGKKNPDKDKMLSELGFDSLDFSETLIFIQEKLGFEVSMSDLNVKNLKEILLLFRKGNKEIAETDSIKKRIRECMRKYPEIVPLSLDGEGICTFWIHPLSGDVGIYNSIAEKIKGSFRMIAIKAKGFLSANQEPIQNVKEMAAYYCEILMALQPDGPYHLVGFSFGGTIAYEMAIQLQRRGKKVDTMVMVESPYITGKDSEYFQISWRSNLIMNANFLLLALMNQNSEKEPDFQNCRITEEEVSKISAEGLLTQLALLCKQKGLRQSQEEIEFKISSMAKVHSCNLSAIRNYKAEPIEHPEAMNVWLFRTKSANAVSKKLWNPDYLERIQTEKGSFLPLMEVWKQVFPDLRTVILEGDNHFDVLHSARGLEQFTNYCSQIFKKKERQKEIAIIGISGRFPDADNIRTFWENLKNGRSSIRKMPDNRGWDIDDYYDSSPKTPGKTYSVMGGFLEDIDKFDPLFFKISPKDAELMDPSERIFIEESWKAVEDAGYNPMNLSGKRWGVYACAKGDYNITILNEDPSYYLPTDSYSAARLSYLLNLTGPAMTIDTACSSTLTVIAEACNNLVLGNCEVAIAGGGAVYSTPNLLIGSSQSLLLSPDETCYAFDKRANGTVVGEAVGAVVLKLLDKAIEDKDHIYGVIRGWGINQDGKTNGITSPSGVAQMELQTQVYEQFGINPKHITMVEAHGTGTKLGDSIEFQAIKKTFEKYTSKKQYCALTSLKTNIGHAFFGSGVAGLIKVLLSMQNKQIPATLNHVEAGDGMDFANSPFYVNSSLTEWKAENGQPRLAAMNAFGATGTNVHLVIQEYEPQQEIEKINPDKPVIIVLSAKNEERLREYTETLLQFAKSEEGRKTDLTNLAYTLQVSRDSMEMRLGFKVSSFTDFIRKIEEFLQYGFIEDGICSKKSRKNGAEETRNQGALQEAVKLWKRDEDAKGILNLWAQGTRIDWKLLYSATLPRRISLPTYPFAKERCWVTQNKAGKQNSRKEKVVLEIKKKNEVYQFTEEWQQSEIVNPEQTILKTVVVFLSNIENQVLVRRQVARCNPQTEVIFITEADKENIHPVFHILGKQKEEISAVLYLWPLENTKYAKEYGIVADIIKAADEEALYPQKLILAAVGTDGINRCYAESWIGFERSLGPMVAKTKVKVVLLERAEQVEGRLLADEIEKLMFEASVDSLSVLYHENKRLQYQIRELVEAQGESPIRMRGTYLITGGFGKLSILLAEYLSSQYKANLILCGRSAYTTDKKMIAKSVEDAGGSVYYIQADICNKEEVRKGIEGAKEIFGEIHGVIHTAGIVEQRLLYDKTISQFKKVIAPKVEGALILDEIFAESKLDFMCLFSSSAAILGDFGACDYAIGNRFLMAFSQYRTKLQKAGKRYGKTVAVSWPLWRDGGMRIKENESYLQASGQKYLETQDALSAFENALLQEEPQILYMTGQRQKIVELLKRKSQTGVGGNDGEHQPVENREFHHNLKQLVEIELKKVISNVYHIAIDKLELDEYLVEYGFDSINLFEFTKSIAECYDIDLTSAELLGQSTIRKIAEYLLKEYQEPLSRYYQKKVLSEKKQGKIEEQKAGCEELIGKEFTAEKQGVQKQEPIAVIGMSGRFPQADSVEEFWKKLYEEDECITEIPKQRWDWKEYFGDPNETPGKTKAIWGAFINGIDEFDPAFFKISPKEASIMDPCQRIFLEEAWHALEDAGYMGERIKGRSCGVYVGAEEGDYGNMVRSEGEFYSNQNAVLSAQIAYFLDLKGPNMSITASCSSGLVALHQACQALRLGECEMAISGGVNLFVSPMAHIGMGMLGLLSPTGKCYVFDERANGMVPGEAVGVVILKPLSKAIRDNDHIYGCIKGSGINYNGRGNGMMAPNPERESELMKQVMEQYQISPQDIEYMITHSVGSPMADAAEINALKKAFGTYKEEKVSLSLGSVKPIIGHTFAASGVVSLIAMLLAIKHEVIPGVYHFEKINPDIHLDKMCLSIDNAAKTWKVQEGRNRTGAISTSANSGTNAFAVIEEYKDARKKPEELKEERQVFVFSAASKASFLALIERYLQFAAEHKKISFSDMAYTLQNGREHMNYRAAVLASTSEELLAGLAECRDSILQKKNVQDRVTVYIGDLENGISRCLSKAGNKIEGALEMIAWRWINGEKVKWDELYEADTRRRCISLPVYPFEKGHYWIGKKKVMEQNIAECKSEDKLGTGKTSEVEEFIIEFFSDKLGMKKEAIKRNKDIRDYGVNSILIMKLIKALKQQYAVEIASRELVGCNTIEALSELMEEKKKQVIQGYKDTQEQAYKDKEIIEVLEQFANKKLTLDDLEKMIGAD